MPERVGNGHRDRLKCLPKRPTRDLRWFVTDLNQLPLGTLFDRLCGEPNDAGSALGRLLAAMYAEDLGGEGAAGWDVASEATIGERQSGVARMVAREPMVLAGLACVPALVGLFAPSVVARVHATDGERAAAGAAVCELCGPLRKILALERSLLNLVARLSGVASMAAKFVAAVEGTNASIYDTRKTTPGLRALEKYAVRCGGAKCHRVGLYDAMLIKDNHLVGVSPMLLPRFVADAVARARDLASKRGQALTFAELEVDTLEQFQSVLDAGGCGLDVVLLDNMSTAQLAQAVALRDRSGVRIELEASGGVRLQTARAIAQTGVERISAGAITHQAVSVDLGLDID